MARKFRTFARQTAAPRYCDCFERGAGALEIEAMGCAASGAVARAIREARGRQYQSVARC